MKTMHTKNEKFSLYISMKPLQFIEKGVIFQIFENGYQQVRTQRYEKTFEN